MSTEQEVRQIEIEIEQARELVKTRDALDRLMENPDFKEVILTGYFKDEPARLVELKAAPQMEAAQHQANIIKSMDGIGALQQYFNTIWHLGSNAESAIQDGHQAIDEIHAEEGGE